MKCNPIILLSFLLLLFSCTKEISEKANNKESNKDSEKPAFYTRTTEIDMDVLNSLRRDSLFQEHVRLLDYSYLARMFDSIRKETSNDEEFRIQSQIGMTKRMGNIKERFSKIKHLYPKEFYRYVFYETRLSSRKKFRYCVNVSYRDNFSIIKK